LRNAVFMRRGEKIILQRWLAVAQAAIVQLEDPTSVLSLPEGGDANLEGYFQLIAKHLPPSA
jgi:hypothetical protein